MKAIKKNLFTTLFQVLLCLNVIAQVPYYECGTIPDSINNYATIYSAASNNCQTSPNYYNKYNIPSYYFVSNLSPVIEIKLVFHVIDFNGQAQQFGMSSATQSHLSQIANWFNNGYERYSIARSANFCTSFVPPFTSDSRIRYKVVGIYYYNSSLYWNSDNHNAMLNYIESVNPGSTNAGIPIIFNNTINVSNATGHALRTGIKPLVHTSAKPTLSQVQTHIDDVNWGTYAHLRHEIMHLFGLLHTYGNQEANKCNSTDFLDDVIPQNCTTCPSNPNACNTCNEGTFNNVSYYSNNVLGLTSGNEWMSPKQMAIRRRQLHLKTDNIRQYVSDLVSRHNNSWTINQNEVWDFDIQMYNDIVVKSGNTLTIKCKVSMPSEGKIIVEKGAKLIIDGGIVTGWCKGVYYNANNVYHTPALKNWAGIEVEGTPLAGHLINSQNGYDPNHGILEVVNSSTISLARNGVSTFVTDTSGWAIPQRAGGIVKISSSYFIDNLRDVFFYGHPVGPNLSYVKNSSFISSPTCDVINGTKEHVKLFKYTNVYFHGCIFESDISWYNTINSPNKPKIIGIYSTDSQISVDRICNGSPCVFLKSKFENLMYGIYIDNINPVFNCVLKNIDFINVHGAGIILENSYNSKVISNSFNIGDTAIGVYCYRSKYYEIKENSFIGNLKSGIGIIAFDSKDGGHVIYKNKFNDFNSGIMPVDNNSQLGINGVGLRMQCNLFNQGVSNFIDIGMTYWYTNAPRIMPWQAQSSGATQDVLVKNLFNASFYNSIFKNKFQVEIKAGATANNVFYGAAWQQIDNPNWPSNQAQSSVVIFSSPNYTLDYEKACPSLLPSSSIANGVGGITNNQVLHDLNNNISNKYNLLTTNQDTSNVSSIVFEIQASVSSKLNLFSADSVYEYRDSIYAILSNNQGLMTDAHIQLILNKIRYREFSDAGNLINNLGQQDNNWKTLLENILKLEKDSLGYDSLQYNLNLKSFFEDRANDSLDGNAIAQGVLTSILGYSHVFPKRFYSTSMGRLLNAHDEGIPNKIEVFPNPTKDLICIKFDEDIGVKAVRLIDLSGRVLYLKKITEERGIINFSTKDLSNGNYFVNLINANGAIISTAKIIKE